MIRDATDQIREVIPRIPRDNLSRNQIASVSIRHLHDQSFEDRSVPDVFYQLGFDLVVQHIMTGYLGF